VTAGADRYPSSLSPIPTPFPFLFVPLVPVVVGWCGGACGGIGSRGELNVTAGADRPPSSLSPPL
jgi:hypothetical protein